MTILHNPSDVEMISCYFYDIYWLGYGPFVTVCDVLVTESIGDEIFVLWYWRQKLNQCCSSVNWNYKKKVK